MFTRFTKYLLTTKIIKPINYFYRFNSKFNFSIEENEDEQIDELDHSSSDVDKLVGKLQHFGSQISQQELTKLYIKTCCSISFLSDIFPVQDKLLECVHSYSSAELNSLLKNMWKEADNFDFAQSTFRLSRDMRNSNSNHVIKDYQFLLDEAEILSHIRIFDINDINNLPQKHFNFLILKLFSSGNTKKIVEIFNSNYISEETPNMWDYKDTSYNPRILPEMFDLLLKALAINVNVWDEYKIKTAKMFSNSLSSRCSSANRLYNLGRK